MGRRFKFKVILGWSVFMLLLASCSGFFGRLEFGVESTDTAGPQVARTDVDGDELPETRGAGDETPVVKVTETPAGKGSVNGMICFPSEFIPEMTIYFQEAGSGSITDLVIEQDQSTFSIELPAGVYTAFAHSNNEEIELGGMYSEAVACGLSAACTDHSLRPFRVSAGEVVDDIDICDWYAQDIVPPRPVGGLDGQNLPLAGLVYSDRSSGRMWQMGQGGELIPILDHPNASLSPDRSRALFEKDGDIWIVDLVSGDQRNLTNTPDRIEVGAQWWRAREGTIVFGSWGQLDDLGPSFGYLSVINVDGANYRVLEGSPSNASPAPAPDGRTIAYDLGGSAWLYRIGGDKERFDVSSYGLTEIAGMNIGSPAWSPDGKTLAWWIGGRFSEGTEHTLAVAAFDLESQTVQILHSYTPAGGFGGWLPTPVWSPDGNWLAVVSLGERNRADIWVVSRDRSTEVHLGWAQDPVWDPSSKFLAYTQWGREGTSFQDGKARVVSVDSWTPHTIDLPSDSFPLDWSVVPLNRSGESNPTFRAVLFSSQQEASQAQEVFPGRIPQIYAIWSYANMREGMTIRRDWYFNGVRWLAREEPWDFAKYGADGVIKDISIYENEVGLDPGEYVLRLYIDDREQTGENGARFRIAEPTEIAPLPSPDGSRVATVRPPGTLLIQSSNGSQRVLLNVVEISSLAWHPDGQRLLYSVRDRSDQSLDGNTVGVVDQLWVVDVVSGETEILATEAENMHDPLIAPDGRHIALISGSGWSDGCYLDRKLWIWQVDENLNLTFSYYQLDFEGLPDPGNAYVTRLLGWETGERLEVEFNWECPSDGSDGIYLLDVSARTAVRIGE